MEVHRGYLANADGYRKTAIYSTGSQIRAFDCHLNLILVISKGQGQGHAQCTFRLRISRKQ